MRVQHHYIWEKSTIGRISIEPTFAPGQAAAPSSRRLASGLVELRWDAAYPMALVRDAVSGEILSFARGGVARITAPPAAVQIDLSTGVASLPGVVLGTP